jgi:hypothetical protein
MRWFRFYDDTVNDPKVQRLPPEMFKTWVNLLCIASKHDGVLPSLADLAFTMRVSEGQLESRLEYLSKVGLFDETETGTVPHNWNGRQYKSDDSNERVKRHRQRKRNVTATANATPPDTETETDTETDTERDKPPNPLKGEFEEFWKAYPRKVARGSASRAFAKAVKKTSPATILEAVKLFAVSCAGKEPDFIPHAATWLNAERWSDAELKPTLSVVSIRSPQSSETREEYIRRLAAMSRA